MASVPEELIATVLQSIELVPIFVKNTTLFDIGSSKRRPQRSPHETSGAQTDAPIGRSRSDSLHFYEQNRPAERVLAGSRLDPRDAPVHCNSISKNRVRQIFFLCRARDHKKNVKNTYKNEL